MYGYYITSVSHTSTVFYTRFYQDKHFLILLNPNYFYYILFLSCKGLLIFLLFTSFETYLKTKCVCTRFKNYRILKVNSVGGSYLVNTVFAVSDGGSRINSRLVSM